MYNKIIIASALDQGFSEKALQVAKRLVSDNGEIITAHVVEPINNVVQSFVSEEANKRAYEAIEEIMATRLNDEQGIKSVILTGNAGNEISKYASKVGADCIIVGSHMPGLQDFFLGSTSARIVRHATCAVHVLR